VDVIFCDICNESVPLDDLREGRAQRVKQRVVCAACQSAMGGETAPATRGGPVPAPHRSVVRPRRTVAGEWVAVASMLTMGVGGWYVLEEVDRQRESGEQASAEQVADLRGSLAGVESRLFDEVVRLNREASERPNSVLTELANLRGLLEAEREFARAERERIAGQLGDVVHELRDLGQAHSAGDQTERAILALENGLAQAQEDIDLLARSLLEGLEFGPARAPAELRGEVAEDQPEWLAWLGGLASADSGERWDTIEQLGQTGDPQCAEHLVPLLDDNDLFVRLAAARVLGDLGNTSAVPALIDALEDGEPSVRETAVLSLRRLTKREFDFDPNAREADRERRIRDWRKWWERSSEATAAPGN
jgi:hypothetical protein